MALADMCPGDVVPGHLRCPGGVFLPQVWTRYVSEYGNPLVTAAQAADMYDIRARTVYEWRRRGFLTATGLDEQGRELYDAAQVAAVLAAPGRRQKVTALPGRRRVRDSLPVV